MAKPPKSKSPRWLHAPIYYSIRAALAGITSLPPAIALGAAERVGRTVATAGPNRKRLHRASANIGVAFPEWSRDRCEAVAVDAYAHLARLSLELAYTPRLLTDDSWPAHIELGEIAPAVNALVTGGPTILITAHVGNWELLGYSMALLGFPMHALYRPLDLPPLDRWVRRTRESRGLSLVDKFGALKQLPEFVAKGAPVGMVADQNAGDRGIFVPYFNRLASTYKSIGLLAMQFDATIACGMAHRAERGGDELLHRRTGLGYRIDVTDVFGPKEWATHPDPLFYLTARYRRAMELMVRRTPGQYLWMHRVWRSRPRHERSGRPFPGALLEKLRLLPWLSDGDLAAIVAHSERDSRTLAETGQSKLS